MKLISQYGILPLIAGAFLFTASAQAQRGGGGGFDMGQIMERMAERYQEALEVSDDEWSVLKPMVVAIVEKQFTSRGTSRFAGFGGGRGRGGRGGDGNQAGERGNRGNRGGDGNQARERGNRGGRGGGGGGESRTSDLGKAIEGGSDAKIKSELAAFRSAKKKSAKELEKARNELRQLLTLKQEAKMVLAGLLD